MVRVGPGPQAPKVTYVCDVELECVGQSSRIADRHPGDYRHHGTSYDPLRIRDEPHIREAYLPSLTTEEDWQWTASKAGYPKGGGIELDCDMNRKQI